VALRERHGLGKRYHEIVAARKGVLESARNQRPWQVAGAILVKENVKGRSGPSVIIIFAEHIHFGDLPTLPSRYDEIVCCLAIKKI
jgi:hypothetical protein